MNTNITKGKWTADEKTYSLESCRIYGLNVIEVSCKKNDEDAGEWIAYVRGNSFEEAKANAQAIASLPDIMRENEQLELMNFKFANENEELKARCETYKKDYDSMVAEVLRLSGENSELLEALKSARDVLAMASWIDKTATCGNESDKIDSILYKYAPNKL